MIEKRKTESSISNSESTLKLTKEERKLIFKKKIRRVMKKCSKQDLSPSITTTVSINPLFNFKEIDIE